MHTIPAKIVCVRNRSNRKDWLAIICTDMELDEKEIIRIYGKGILSAHKNLSYPIRHRLSVWDGAPHILLYTINEQYKKVHKK